MLSDRSLCNKRTVMVAVPGIQASYSVSAVHPGSLEPKLVHSWIQARQKNQKVKASADVTSCRMKTTQAAPHAGVSGGDRLIDGEVVRKGGRKLPPIASLYTPQSPPSAQPRKTVYSCYMDNLQQSPVNQKSRSLKWEGHYQNKTQDPSAETPLSYDFINFVGSPMLSREKHLECLKTSKNTLNSSKPIATSREPSFILPSSRPSVSERLHYRASDVPVTPSTHCEQEVESEGHVLDSMTLPCIEEILRSEGIEECDIMQQLRIIKDDELNTFIKSDDQPKKPERVQQFPKLTTVSVSVVSDHLEDRKNEKAISRSQELNPFLNGQIREWLQNFKHKQNLSTLRQVPEMPIIISKSTQRNQNIPVTNITVPNHFWPRVVLVANNIPKSDLLVNTVLHRRNDLITIHYAFDSHNLSSLLRDLQKKLQTYHQRWNTTAMKSLLVICNGGPGYFHLVKGKPITTQVLQKDESVDVTVGSYFHLMGCDAFSGKLGKQFLSLLEKKLSPCSVTVEQLDSRLGRQQILKLYMDPKQYRRWTERLAKLEP